MKCEMMAYSMRYDTVVLYCQRNSRDFGQKKRSELLRHDEGIGYRLT